MRLQKQNNRRKGEVMGEIRFMAAGDRAMVAEFGNVIDNAVNNKIHLLAARITAEHLPGIEELVPTFRSLMIYYDPERRSERRSVFLRFLAVMGRDSGWI